jgi:3-hydroxybutyryl-CoA dehydrogenase
MQIVVLSNDSLKEEMSSNGINQDAEIIWINDVNAFATHSDADAYIDLLFENTKTRINALSKLLPKQVIINSVTDTLKEINESFIRINAWPAFLKTSGIEASAQDQTSKEQADRIFHAFNKKLEWVKDEPGFITARVISMIINEAFLALEEGVSSKEAIDTAMKLGTNYPFGPFEWAQKIGLKNIANLLTRLSASQPRYKPCALLIQYSLEQ